MDFLDAKYMSSLEKQVGELKDTIKALTATLNNQEDALSSCSESFAFVRGENDRLTADNEELTKWNERYKESNDKLVKMHQDCSDWVSRLIADNTGLTNELDMLREKNGELQAIADRAEVGY